MGIIHDANAVVDVFGPPRFFGSHQDQDWIWHWSHHLGIFIQSHSWFGSKIMIFSKFQKGTPFNFCKKSCFPPKFIWVENHYFRLISKGHPLSFSYNIMLFGQFHFGRKSLFSDNFKRVPPFIFVQNHAFRPISFGSKIMISMHFIPLLLSQTGHARRSCEYLQTHIKITRFD